MKHKDKELLDYIGLQELSYIPMWKKGDRDKILNFSDPHEPYGKDAVFEDALSKHGDASTVVVSGDIGDFYSKSRFRKTKHQSFKDELRGVLVRLRWLAERFENVEVMLGNHDNRPEKLIAQLFAGHEDMMIFTEQNVLGRLCKYFPNVKLVGTRIPGSASFVNHVYQKGDIIFTHAEISRMQKTAVMERISVQLHRWKDVFGLKPYSVIAQGHNHTWLSTPMGSEWWYQLPMAADQYSLGLDYAINNARMIGTPGNMGYTVFYQRKGKTDNNRTQVHII